MSRKSICLSLIIAIITIACNGKQEEKLVEETTTQQNQQPKEQTEDNGSEDPNAPKSTTKQGKIDWDKRLDEYEAFIDKNNQLIQKLEKGDSSVIAEIKDLQKKKESLEKDINPYKLSASALTPEQVERLAKLQKKQRQETTNK